MTTETLDKLYNLLPTIYRLRDGERGYPLRALLQVIAEQVNVVEADIEQLYENWFIETCEDWVVPYIGDLLGYKPVHEAGEPGDINTLAGQQLNKILIPRREVANVIHNAKRKGTLALLETLARDVAGWPARAVEFYKLLGYNQPINHLHPERGTTVNVRHIAALDRLNGPFDKLGHTVEVRRPNSHRTQGRYNIPSVGLFVWRLQAYSVTHSQAYCLEQLAPNFYTFSVLGNDAPIYTKPVVESDATDIAGELNLPVPIKRRTLEKNLADYYGPDKSFYIWRGVARGRNRVEKVAVKLEEIVVADLTDWTYRPVRGKTLQVAVDPELGRIAFPTGPSNTLPEGLWVTYHYGFPADIGGGEYPRPILSPAEYFFDSVQEGDSIQFAINRWRRDPQRNPHAVIEIRDSGVYTEQLTIELSDHESLQLRAASGCRPVLRLLDQRANQADSLTILVGKGSRVTLDGLLITGRAVKVETGQTTDEPPVITVADPNTTALATTDSTSDGCQHPTINIRHCTLVPGWSLHGNCDPRRPNEASLEIYAPETHVNVEHTIIGSIQVSLDEVGQDPIPVAISDTILDATSPELYALGTPAPGFSPAHAILTIQRSTVIGEVQCHAIDLAENTIFYGRVQVRRRQRGCVRFCYVTPDSRTPRRYHCQPDLVDAAVAEDYADAPQTERDRLQRRERLRVLPQFNSQRYATPTYCQLADTCAVEIRRGADDESEMGVYHDLYQPQREANLMARLEQFTPAGAEAGIIFVN